MTEEPCRAHLRIGKLAREVGLNPKTIRFYEEIGLLPAPRRNSAGYRLYDETARDRLRFIAKAKSVGLTLQEIGEVLAPRDAGTEPCSYVQELIDRKLTAVDAQLRRLADHRRDLLALQAEATMIDCSCIPIRGIDAPICGIIELHQSLCDR